MAPSSFSAAIRQLDNHDHDGNEDKNAYTSSTIRPSISRNLGGSHVEPMGYARNGAVVVDYSQANNAIPDRFSYRTSSAQPRSSFSIPYAPRRSEHPRLYKNDSNRYLDGSLSGQIPNDTPKWDEHKLSLSPVREHRHRDSLDKKSLMCKYDPSHGTYHGQENHHGNWSHRSNARYDVQPGFQRVNYDGTKQQLETAKKRNADTMIEVSPGEFLRLRGADETWQAIHNDFYIPCTCVMCDITLFCIQDAVFVLCPTCFIVSPLEGVVYDGYDGGVGMGFTMEKLAMWQEEIRNEGN